MIEFGRPPLQVKTSKNSKGSDCCQSHFLRKGSSAFFIADEKGGVLLLCLYYGLRFTQVQLRMEKLDVCLVGCRALSKDASLVEFVEAVSKSSFSIHFALDSSWHVNYVEE